MNSDPGASKSIGWSHSFVLALKATIIGFLLGLIWVVIHTIIKYSLWVYSLQAYYGYWSSPDFGQMLLDDFLSLFFPFMPFQPSGSSGSPIFWLFGFVFGGYVSGYDIMLTILGLLFLLLVYVSQLVPIIKISSDEAGHSISWKRGYIVGIKAGIVGLILAVIFVSIGSMATFFMLFAAFPSSGGSTSPSEYSPGMILGGIILVVLLVVILLLFAETATGAAVIKYTTSEAKRGGIGWMRSFWVAIKASIVGLLWAILFSLIFGLLFGIILIATIGSLSATSIAAGAGLVLIMLFITLVLVSLAPTASIIKYLNEEILKMPRDVEVETRKDLEGKNGDKKVDSKVLRDNLLPSDTTGTEPSAKKECGNCSLFLTINCPRNYPSDNDIWRSQKPCDLFETKKA